MATDYLKFKDLLKRERIKCNLSISELADKAGCNKSYISEIESGINVPNTDFIDRVNSVLLVDSGLLYNSALIDSIMHSISITIARKVLNYTNDNLILTDLDIAKLHDDLYNLLIQHLYKYDT